MKEKIIETAWEEAAVHSLRFTMADIARRAHMSKTSIYKVFASKDALVHEMLSYRIKTYQQDLKKGDIAGSLAKQIRHFVECYINLMSPIFSSGLYRDLEFSYPEEYIKLEVFYGDQVDYVTNLLQKGVDAGEFRPINLAVVQRALYVSTEAMLDARFLASHNLTYKEAVENLEDLLFNGILEPS